MTATAETKGPSALRNAFGSVLGVFILLLIGVLAFSIRLFSVIKYESVIHEFDPYFNYRVTQYLTKNGIYDFWNWFDDRTWYPLGRVIGGTVFPGLTLTAGSMWWLLNSLNIPLSVETVCVFTAPIFSANAAWATYLLTKEVKGTGAGLTAAVLLAMVTCILYFALKARGKRIWWIWESEIGAPDIKLGKSGYNFIWIIH